MYKCINLGGPPQNLNLDLPKTPLTPTPIFGAKWANFDSFGAKMRQTGFFWEKAKMSLPYAYYAATLCKKPEQTYERILRSRKNERTDERTDGRE